MRRLVLGGVLAIAFVGGAQAQDYAFQGFAASDAMNQMHASMRENMIVAPAGRSPVVTRAAPPRATGRISTTYRPDPTVRREIEARLIRAVSAQDAEAAARLESAMRENDFVRVFDQALGRFGLRSGNAVDAMTAYWLAMWGAANNYQGQPTRTQVEAVKAQVASGFDFQAAGLRTPAALQEFSETLIYQTVLLDSAVEEAQRGGRSEDVRRLGDEAQRQMRAAGMDLRSLELTDAGLVPA